MPAEVHAQGVVQSCSRCVAMFLWRFQYSKAPHSDLRSTRTLRCFEGRLSTELKARRDCAMRFTSIVSQEEEGNEENSVRFPLRAQP